MHSLVDTVFVFDLDDTLYSERTYESSGILAVWELIKNKKPQVHESLLIDNLLQNRDKWIEQMLQFESNDSIYNHESLLNYYRNHFPNIKLYEDSVALLTFLVENDAKLAMITDGRSVSQRQKLRALKIEHIFDPVCISEETNCHKPLPGNYELLEQIYPGYQFIYIGDNPKKDFITPNRRGWFTYGLRDRGFNVHSQQVPNITIEYYPKIWINSLTEIISLINII